MAHPPRRSLLVRGRKIGDPINWCAALVLLMTVAACSAPPGDSSPSADGLASSSPQISASAVEATASAEPSASSSGGPGGGVEVDALARTAVDRLRIREDPGLGGASLGTLAEGDIGYVVGGPVSADGYDWYLVSALGLPQASGCAGPIEIDPFTCPSWIGWIAAQGPDGDPWLVAGTVDCPPWPSPQLTDKFVFGVQMYAYLACFGDEVGSIVGFYPEIPPEAGLGGACAFDTGDLGWIGCNLGYEHIVLDAAAGFGSPGLVLSIDPASGVQLPARGQWIEVTGQYDHPAAQGCTWAEPPEASVLACRAQFVVESVRAVDAP